MSMRAGLFFLAMVMGGCASHHLPPGNELEHADTNDESEPNTVDQSKMPTQSQELAKAFEPPPAPAVAPKQVQPERPKEPDLDAQARADFKTRLDEAKRMVARNDVESATQMLGSLAEDADRVGPTEVTQVFELQVKLGLQQKEKDWRTIRKSAEHWLGSCGPEKIDACRAKAQGVLAKVASAKTPEAAAAKARGAAEKNADRCLHDAEVSLRAHAPLPGCLEAAAGHYKHHADRLMSARIALLKAQAAAAGDKKDRALELYVFASNVCEEQRCGAVRRRALKLAGWLALENGDPAQAAKLMIEEMGVGAERLPVEKRRYARTPEVDKVCAVLDGRDGPGACRKLEKQLLGDYIFKDFSVQKAGAGLAADTVRTVNEHYNISLQECLAAEAGRLVPPAYETYEVQWMVGNDGRVDQVHMGKKTQDETELAMCLRRVFAVWRYPRYEGEAQHVQQSFTVSAHQRR
ncbi:MAG: hypothetical protein JNK82_30700 [Myxococcaceae bacterium]|nr:hypothetical protein [Myxococcaceae bacterium]